MSRRFAAAVAMVAAAVVGAAAPRPAAAQTADEEAALILYESGRERFKAGDLEGAARDLEKAWGLAPNLFVRYYLALSLSGLGRCDEASSHLKALQGQLRGEQESARRDAVASCGLRAAAAASGTGDCDAANRALEALPEPLSAEHVARRTDLFGRCEVERAAARADAGRCADVLGELEALDAERVSVDTSRRRAGILSRCRREVIGFDPESAAQKAAAVLVLEGLSLRSRGAEAEAAGRFEKALKLHDVPAVRVHAARSRVSSGACAEGLAHAEVARKAGHPGMEAEIADLQAWCDTFSVPADAPLDAGQRRELQARYRAALQAGDAGLADLVASLSLYDQPRVRLFAGRRLADQGRWDEAAQVLEGAAGRLSPAGEKEVADLLAVARFAARDRNGASDKRQVFAEWRRGHDLLAANRDAEAEVVLRGIEANPLVARDLAELAARRGDCPVARLRVEEASRGVTLGQEWVEGLLDRCRQVAERNRKESERQAAEAAAAQRASQARGRKIASYALWAAGAAAAGAGAYFGWAWSDARGRSIDRMKEYDRATTQEAAEKARKAVKSAQSDQQLDAILGGTMAAVAVGCIAGGVVTWLQAKALEAPPALTVAPLAAPRGAGLALTGVFP